MLNPINNSSDYNVKTNVNANIKATEKELSQAEIRMKKRSGELECQRCASRKYVDGSDDAGVSFKTPRHVSPSQSAAAVVSHEREHYNRETSGARMEGKEVVSANISIQRSICPECGMSYVSGGLTSVTTRKRVDADKAADNAHFRDNFYQGTVGKHMGKAVDKKI